MRLDYQFINNIYQKIFNSSTSFQAIVGMKLLCAILLVVWYYYKFFASTAKKDDTFSPLSSFDIMKGVALLLTIAFYDQFLSLLDNIFSAIEGQYATLSVEPRLGVLNEMSEDALEIEKPKGWEAAIIELVYSLGSVLTSPLDLIFKVLEAVIGIIDYIMYALFLAERFFFIGVLRILGGLAIACAAIPKLEKWFWNWLSTYTALWLLAIPLMLGNFFTNEIYNNMQLGVGSVLYGMRLIMLTFIVWLKFKIFSKSQTYIFKIFS